MNVKELIEKLKSFDCDDAEVIGFYIDNVNDTGIDFEPYPCKYTDKDGYQFIAIHDPFCCINKNNSCLLSGDE